MPILIEWDITKFHSFENKWRKPEVSVLYCYVFSFSNITFSLTQNVPDFDLHNVYDIDPTFY